jgi:FkbM family methyltransferase
MANPLRNLLRRVKNLTQPRPKSLGEWAQDHGEVVRVEIQRLLPHVPENALVIDVGANVGLFSEALLRERPSARVIQFEPVTRYHQACQERFAGDDRVELHKLALSDAQEERPIYKARHNYGANSVMPEIMFDRRDNAMVRPDTVIDQETIQCTTWELFAKQHGIEHVDFIKTDTEGFDYAVLRGMLPFLERAERLPVIYSELLEEDYHPRWEEQAAVVERLFEIGYEYQDLSSMAKVDDILFLPAQGNF